MIDLTKLSPRDRGRIEARRARNQRLVFAHDAFDPGSEHYNYDREDAWRDVLRTKNFRRGQQLRVTRISLRSAKETARRIETEFKSARLFRVERLSDSSIRITRIW